MGCSRSGNSEGTRTSNGGTAIFGSLYIAPECGAGIAQVSISPPASGMPIAQAQIGNGGSFDFQLATGTYTVTAQAGGCQLQPTQVPTVANRSCPYAICLALSSGCPQAQQTLNYGACGASYPGGAFNYGSAGGYCSYGTYGCMGSYYPGTGYTAYGKPNLYLKSPVTTEFELDIEFLSGSNRLGSTPTLGMNGWKGTISSDGKITVDGVNYNYLDYSVQADHKGQQFKSGFCAKRDEIGARMATYLEKYGFSERAVRDFRSYVKTEKLPLQETICAYPQQADQIKTVLRYKSNVDLNLRQVWFTLVPQNEVAVLKISPIPELLKDAFQKPSLESFADLEKKSPQVFAQKAELSSKVSTPRSIANRPVIEAEEWGLGFFLQK
jgi:hypothetical protein